MVENNNLDFVEAIFYLYLFFLTRVGEAKIELKGSKNQVHCGNSTKTICWDKGWDPELQLLEWKEIPLMQGDEIQFGKHSLLTVMCTPPPTHPHNCHMSAVDQVGPGPPGFSGTGKMLQ